MKFKLALVMLATVSVFSLVSAASCGGKTGSLKVSVMDSAYNLLWGATVVSESQPAGQLKIDGITSQEGGGVVFNGVKPGDYQIQVTDQGFTATTLEVTVTAGETESVSVELYYAPPAPIT